MPKSWFAIGAVLLSTFPALAQEEECTDFGLDNTYLQAHFCSALKQLRLDEPRTRSAQSGNDADQTDMEVPPWADLPVVRDAYRADPGATLELIERIKNAGGLTDN